MLASWLKGSTQEKQAYKESYRKARIARAKQRGKAAGSMTLGDQIIKQVMKPPAKRKAPKARKAPSISTGRKKRRPPTANDFDFGFDIV